ncbi:unconventional prefoldin RPB5 interactor-like protein [Wyeomyia smithii]|uniref:unconventional prefoldin RPB5 interactor-like protein n=1 Tax=Wyeomyia smithii TaxID=174621 RepID=UPI002467E79F|nr:unconventional prefoldin RPB5 interactor-like protein [Wyeomyia smithii]
MEVYNKVYIDALAGNEQETNRWTSYREELRQVKENLKFYQSQLKVDILIPIGSKALIPGQLYHTGEVMASHGCGYFSDCSIDQATRIIDHRISNADRMLQKYEREKDLFVSKLEVPFAEDAFGGREIIEEYDEDREKMWREQHRKRVKEHKQQEGKKLRTVQPSESDENVFSRLEELELMEELEQEMERLEVTVENDEQLRQLMSGDLKVNKKKRVAHNSEPDLANAENVEIETTEDENSSDGSSYSDDDISPEFAKLLQQTKSMDVQKKVDTFRAKLVEINDKLRQGGITVDEKVVLCDLRYEVEESLDFLCPSWESTEKPSKKIKFAETDSVKIIENPEPQSLKSKLTLELNVSHSAVHSNESVVKDGKEIVSPADIYRLFEHCLQKEDSSTASNCKTKSILKNREKVLEEIHLEEASVVVKNQREKVSVPVDIIGEVIEHSSESLRETKVETVPTKSPAARKVSRFKKQRS